VVAVIFDRKFVEFVNNGYIPVGTVNNLLHLGAKGRRLNILTGGVAGLGLRSIFRH